MRGGFNALKRQQKLVRRLFFYAAVVGLAIGALFASMIVPSWDPNAFSEISYVEILIPIAGLIAGMHYGLALSGTDAPAILGAGVYTLIVGFSFSFCTWLWFRASFLGDGLWILVLSIATCVTGALMVCIGIGGLVRLNRLHARHPRPIKRPLVLALSAGLLTGALLFIRGSGDWVIGSPTVRLYSFPIIIMTVAIASAIYDVSVP